MGDVAMRLNWIWGEAIAGATQLTGIDLILSMFGVPNDHWRVNLAIAAAVGAIGFVIFRELSFIVAWGIRKFRCSRQHIARWKAAM